MINVEGLTRKYGAFTAVDDVSFVCQPGRVTGFLGPNGAGKTTTMRVMVGLTPATSGRRHHRRPPLPRHPQPGPARRRAARRLGPARRPHRPRDPHHRRRDHGPAGLARRRDARPGLARRRPRPSAGCATTPSACGSGSASRTPCSATRRVLILDEPANGLDPAGIRWMRGLLKGYADRGGTVLLSSHLLHEVEQIADEMILIGRGRIVARAPRTSCCRPSSTRPRTSPRSTTSCSPRRSQAKGLHRLGGRHRSAGRGAARRRGHGRRRGRDRPHRPPLGGRRPRGAVPRPSPRTRSATNSPRAPRRHPPSPKEPRHEHSCHPRPPAARHLRDQPGPDDPAGRGRGPQGPGHPGRPLADHRDPRARRRHRGDLRVRGQRRRQGPPGLHPDPRRRARLLPADRRDHAGDERVQPAQRRW